MSRIALQIFLVFFLSLLIMAGAATGITSWYLQQQRQALSAEIREHAGAAAQALATDGVAGLAEWARMQQTQSGEWVVLVFDEWGEEILGRERPATPAAINPPLSPWLDSPAVTLDLGRETPVLINEFGEPYQLVPVPAANTEMWQLTRGEPRMVVWLALLLITLGTSWILARFLTRPILDLQVTLQSLARGQLAARVPARTVERKDELGQLARALDEMSMQLERLIASREELLRDISHELRSPLARMRLAVGLLEQTPDAVANDLALERIERDITRLDQLIAGILDLSRLETDLRADERVEDLLPWLERALEDAGFEAEQAGKALKFDLPKNMMPITGSAEWSAAAVENVVRNAIRHTPPSGTIEVQVKSSLEGHRVQIFNPGDAIPDDKLSKIFDPFFRVDADRARHSGGVGLGLAIAARVMRAHGGSIRARNLPAGDMATSAGVEFDLYWPRSADPKLQSNA